MGDADQIINFKRSKKLRALLQMRQLFLTLLRRWFSFDLWDNGC